MICSDCHSNVIYYQEYNKWFCHVCNKWIELPPDAEMVLAAIPRVSHKLDECTLYFTTKRVISARADALFFGIGSITFRYSTDQKWIIPGVILSQDKGNLDLDYANLISLIFKKGIFYNKMIFEMADGRTFKFSSDYVKECMSAIQAITPVLGPKLILQ
jgi:hypothetical protein